jgi:L-asparaginase/Glu-tRNA(Gln) amidotransferase subunit D
VNSGSWVGEYALQCGEQFPTSVGDLLTQLAEAMPVVLASRTGAGSVLAHTYDFPGSEADLLRRGPISAGFLDPLKARILLHQLLVAGLGQTAIRAMFTRAGGYAQPDQKGHNSTVQAVVRA